MPSAGISSELASSWTQSVSALLVTVTHDTFAAFSTNCHYTDIVQGEIWLPFEPWVITDVHAKRGHCPQFAFWCFVLALASNNYYVVALVCSWKSDSILGYLSLCIKEV